MKKYISENFIKLFIYFILCFLSLGETLFISNREVSAQNNQNLDAVNILPAFYEVNATAGDEISFLGRIENNTEFSIRVEIEFRDLELETLVKEDLLILREEEVIWGPASWLKSDVEVIFVPGKSFQEIGFILKLPDDASIEGNYPAIVYKVEQIDADAERVEIKDQIISLVYLNIGEVKGEFAQSSARISKFEVKKKIVFTPSADFDLVFDNIGNTFIHPRGRVHIYNSKGTHLSGTPTINDKFIYLLPGQSLQEDLAWHPEYKFSLIPPFGKYNVIVDIYHNPNQESISKAETSFYVIPIWHILIIVGVVVLVVSLILLARQIKRNYL